MKPNKKETTMKKVTAYTIGDVNQYSKRELMEIIYQLGINSTRYYDEENPDFENVKKRIDSIIPNEIVIKCHPLILNYTKNIAISKVEFKRKDNDELILRYKEN